ncbi:MAG: GntR family transcriptional regulator [Kiritimatiellae bacterium]|nr:GntR family transcriptional regulator [Kiritimatiellia bacterium]
MAMEKGIRSGTKPWLVFEALRTRIREGELPNGARLASITGLAREFGTARATVQVAIAALRREGLVTTRKGSGVYVTGGVEAERELTSAAGRAADIARELEQAIVQGAYRLGDVLPYGKVLQYRFGASAAVVRRALDLVAQHGLLQCLGRRYRVSSPTSGKRTETRRIVTVLASVSQLDAMAGWRVSREFIRSLEMELNRFGASEMRAFDLSRQSPRRLRGLTRRDTIGFLHLGAGRAQGRRDPAGVAAEIGVAARTGLPVVVFNYADELLCVPRVQRAAPSNLGLLHIDNRAAGEAVGRHLAGLGHRHAAFFGYFSEAAWCEKRYKGFTSAFRALAGPQAGVRRLFGHEHASRAEDRARVQRVSDEVTATLKRAFRDHGFLLRDPVAEGRTMIRDLMNEDSCRRVMAALFADALRDTRVTAWACSDEMTAIAAWEFLARHNVSVPAQLSLAGINNAGDLVPYGITAYDFRKSQMGYLAAHFLMQDLPISRDAEGVIRSPGDLVIRSSTARPASAPHGAG